MTREDAIAKLKNFADHCYPNEEFLMAIKALEQEPSTTPKQRMCFDGMTNGEVIKTLFPSCKTRSENTPTSFMEFTLDGVVGSAIEKSWWNAPYEGRK